MPHDRLTSTFVCFRSLWLVGYNIPLRDQHPFFIATPPAFDPIKLPHVMSRRKAFDTDLTSSNPRPSQTTPKKGLATNSPPSPSHAAQTVPTETDEEKAEALGVAPTPPEIDDMVQCFICAEPITFWSVGVCGHRTCQYVGFHRDKLDELYLGNPS